METLETQPTLRDLVGKFNSATWGITKQKPWRQQSRDLDKFIEWAGGAKLAQELVTADIEGFLDSLATAALGPQTRYRIRASLCNFWDWLLREGYALWNPVTKTQPITWTPAAAKPLTPKQIAALLGAARDDYDKLLVLLPLTAGISPRALCRLTRKSFDLSSLRKDVALLLQSEQADGESSRCLIPLRPTLSRRWSSLLRRAQIEWRPVSCLTSTFRFLVKAGATHQLVPMDGGSGRQIVGET